MIDVRKEFLQLSYVKFIVVEAFENVDIGPGGVFDQQSVLLCGTAVLDEGFIPDRSETWTSCNLCISPKIESSDVSTLDIGDKTLHGLFYLEGHEFLRFQETLFNSPSLASFEVNFRVNRSQGTHSVDRFGYQRARRIDTYRMIKPTDQKSNQVTGQKGI